MKKFKKRVRSWKELEKYGTVTEQGLYIPTGIYGLKGTKIVFDEDDENDYLKELQREANKKQRGRILAVGILN
jgi:hypothetical protein